MHWFGRIVFVLLLMTLVVGIIAFGVIGAYSGYVKDSWKEACFLYDVAPTKSRIVVSCTTIPSQLHSLKRTLSSVLQMEPPPSQIFVNIPRICERTQEVYVVPDWLRTGPFTLLADVDDTGPSTKYLPTLHHLAATGRANDPVLVIDDDQIIHGRTLRFLEQKTKEFPSAALTFAGKIVPRDLLVDEPSGVSTFDRTATVYAQKTWRARLQRHGFTQRHRYATEHEASVPVDIIMGHSTYVVRASLFDLDRLSNYDAMPKEARFVDDIVISGCLAERNVPRLVVHGWPEPLKEVHAVLSDLRGEFLQHTKSQSLHNSVNRTSHNDDTMIQYFKDAW